MHCYDHALTDEVKVRVGTGIFLVEQGFLMIQWIQRFGRRGRLFIFTTLLTGSIILLVVFTIILILLSFNPNERSIAVSLAEDVRVMEFVTLPDDDAYPSAVAVAPDGTVYTASFATGAVWAISPEAEVRELADTRNSFASVAGITVGPNGEVYVIARAQAHPLSAGGSIQRISLDGQIRLFAAIQDEQGFMFPDDLTFDADGNLYVTDRGRSEIWRFDANGEGIVWWTPPENAESTARPAPTGISYDPDHNAIIITDSNTSTLYRVNIADGHMETLYAHGTRPNAPEFDGVTVAQDGTIYVAALGQNGIARVEGDELVYIAGLFRGSSDLDAHAGDLYIANFDSRALVLPLVNPQLPFALDKISFSQ